MATLYTRTYTYTGLNKWANTARSVPWSYFEQSGDTASIQQIVSIRYEHYHGSSYSYEWALQGQITLSNGTVFKSDTVSKRTSSAVLFTNAFSSLPSASEFSSISSIQTLANGSSAPASSAPYLTWNASEKFKMKVIVEYYDVPPWIYNPKIEKFSIARCTSSGALSDSGTYGLISMKLNIAAASYIPISYLYLFYQGSAGASSYKALSLDSYIRSACSSEITLNTYSLGLPSMSDENDWKFQLMFACSNESTQSIAILPNTFVSLHISPCSTGGVSIGDLSTSTEGNPKFEVHHPAYFYGGIVPDAVVRPAMNAGYTTPGSYGGTLTFRRIGNLAIVSGSVAKAANADVVVCDLPDGFIPSSDYYAMAPCTGAYVARIGVYSSTHANAPGKMGVEYVRTFGSSSAVTSAISWIDLSMVYWID